MYQIIILVIAMFFLSGSNINAQVQYVVNIPNNSGNLIGSSGAPFVLNSSNNWTNTSSGYSTIHYNKDYQFNIPANAIIKGIQVNCDVIITNLVDSSVYLQKNNTIVGSDGAFHLPIISAPAISWGGNTDLWGTSWTPSEINDSTFGVQFRVKEIDRSNPFGWGDARPVEIGIYYEVPTNITDIKKNNLFTVFPNPTKDNIEIEFNSIKDEFPFELYNSQGLLIKSKLITKNNNKIDLQELDKGLYFIRFKYKNSFSVEKILVE